MATPTLTVYAYGNVDALHGTFNAIAMVMGSADFRDMIRVAVVIGFLVVASVALMPNSLSRGWTWFINVALISGVLLVPKANVSIVDKLGVQAPVVVSNVPWALALVASVKSSIGSTLTDLFETSFQAIPGDLELPAELSYEQHGVMFGNRLVKTSREGDFSSLYYQGDTLNYMRNCVFPEMARAPSTGSLEKSTSLITDIAPTNPALFSTYHPAPDSAEVVSAPCPEVYAKAVAPGAVSSAQQSLQSMAAQLYPGVSTSTSQPQLESSLVAMYGKSALAGAASSAQDIMIQNILINAVADASALYGAQLEDPSVLMFASMRSQAVGQMNAGYLVQGRIAEEALPILRNITEAILFAMFPMFCIMAMTMEGQALARLIKSYVYTMVWLELWPPMFAIVNFLATLAATKNLAGAAQISGGSTGLTLQTATGIFSTSVSDTAVASWMVTFVPILAAAILWGADKVMSVANASGGGGAADRVASDGSRGNLSMGNVTMDQQQIQETRSDARVRVTQGIGGSTHANMLTGETVDQYAQSSGPVSVKDTSGWGQRASESAQAATKAGESHQRGYETSLNAAYNQVMGVMRSGGASARNATGFDAGRDSAEALAASEIDNAASQIGKQFGITDSSDIKKAISAGVGSPILLKGSIDSSSAEGESLRTAITEARQAVHQKSVDRKQSVVDSFRSSESFASVRNSDRQATSRVDSAMSSAESYRERAAKDFAESQQYQQQQEKYAAFSRMGVASWNNEFYSFARSRGVDPMHGHVPTATLQGLLQEFILSGELAKHDSGDKFWVPHQGQGPNIVQGQLDNITPENLRHGYEASAPGGGRAGVVRSHATNDGRVQAAQRAAGVSPTQVVDGAPLQHTVESRQDASAVSIEGKGGALQAEQGSMQKSDDERMGKVDYSSHAPIYSSNPITGASNENKALREGYDRTRPFKDEAQQVDDRKADERTREAAMAAEVEKDKAAHPELYPKNPTVAGVPTR